MDTWKPKNPTYKNFTLIGQGFIVLAMPFAMLAMFIVFG